jgi:phosphocarrier protein
VIENDVEIVNPSGLHARAAAKLVHLASSFECTVHLVRDGRDVDGKSILGILLLAAPQGSSLTVRCDGSDEDDAMAAIRDLFAAGFGETGD